MPDSLVREFHDLVFEVEVKLEDVREVITKGASKQEILEWNKAQDEMVFSSILLIDYVLEHENRLKELLIATPSRLV